MKVIATTSTGVLIEATKTELANLLGFYSEYATRDGLLEKFASPGAEVRISPMYQRLYQLESVKSQLEGTQRTLRAVADLLDPVIPIIEPPKQP